MTLLCLSFCPVVCFSSLSAFFCFQVIWAVMYPLFLLYFVQVTSSLTRYNNLCDCFGKFSHKFVSRNLSLNCCFTLQAASCIYITTSA